MKVFIVAVLISVAAAKSAYPTPSSAPAYPAPAAAPAYPPPAGAPAYPSKSGASEPESYPAQPYSFNWEVKDAESKNDYSHSESSDGKIVTGSYSVVLPDTRTQIVTYKGDDNTGYVADVKYQGEAKYPDAKAASSYPAPGSAYPAPATYPAPSSKAPANKY